MVAHQKINGLGIPIGAFQPPAYLPGHFRARALMAIEMKGAVFINRLNVRFSNIVQQHRKLQQWNLFDADFRHHGFAFDW